MPIRLSSVRVLPLNHRFTLAWRSACRYLGQSAYSSFIRF